MIVNAEHLGEAGQTLLSHVLADIAPSWSVELHVFSAHDVSILLMPEDADDPKGPTIIVQQDGGGFRLDQLWWDIYTELGSFSCLPDLAAAVRTRLIHLLMAAAPLSNCVH